MITPPATRLGGVKKRVVALGEILWDLLPSGKMLGGAPANFGIHAHAMDAEVELVSRVGNDELGAEALERLCALGISTRHIGVDSERPTGTVSVELDDGQPRYVIHEGVAWDAIRADEEMEATLREADAVCFGSLAQRSAGAREALQRLIAAAPAEALRVFDINLRQQFYSREVIVTSLRAANLLKLNDAELPVLGEMFALAGSVQERLEALLRQFRLRGVVYTKGADGSTVCVDGEWSELPATPVIVRDTIGAGDAFTAAVVTGLLAGQRLSAVHERANRVAAYVCGHDGPTPPLPQEFRMRCE